MNALQDPELADFVQQIYGELRQIAGVLLRRERTDHTLQPTALAHEACIRLFQSKSAFDLPPNRFLKVAARQMRRTLIDHARSHLSQKRGGELDRVNPSGLAQVPTGEFRQWLALDQALQRLGLVDARALRVVELKHFSGHTNEEIAEILGISSGLVQTDWQFARAWLHGQLTETRSRA